MSVEHDSDAVRTEMFVPRSISITEDYTAIANKIKCIIKIY